MAQSRCKCLVIIRVPVLELKNNSRLYVAWASRRPAFANSAVTGCVADAGSVVGISWPLSYIYTGGSLESMDTRCAIEKGTCSCNCHLWFCYLKDSKLSISAA
eukprot:scaffold116765_cov20-Prasinocladus_malaysianus.AAC.1